MDCDECQVAAPGRFHPCSLATEAIQMLRRFFWLFWQSCVLSWNTVIWWVSPTEHVSPWQTTPSLIWQTVRSGFLEKKSSTSFYYPLNLRNNLRFVNTNKQQMCSCSSPLGLLMKSSLGVAIKMLCITSCPKEMVLTTEASTTTTTTVVVWAQIIVTTSHMTTTITRDKTSAAFKWNRLKAICCHMQ